jgi:hypothetical protein
MDRNEHALSNLAFAFTTTKVMVHFHKAGNTECQMDLQVMWLRV